MAMMPDDTGPNRPDRPDRPDRPRPDGRDSAASEQPANTEALARTSEELEGWRARAEEQAHELAETHAELETSRDHFAELYDFAPIAYCTLNHHGLIVDINLRGTELLGRVRDRLLGTPLLPHVLSTDRRRLLDHLYRCRTDNEQISTELWLNPVDAEPVFIQLFSRPSGHRDRYRTAMIDQTESIRARTAAENYRTHLEDLNRELEHRTREAERRAQQLQTLTLQLTHAEHSERRRIARFIHDQLQQLLVTAKLQTGMLSSADPDSIKARAQRMRELLDTALERSRDLSYELCPPVLYDYGLFEATKWLAEQYREDRLMEVDVRAEPSFQVTHEDLQVFLFQAVRELLLNALKHAGATRTTVALAQTEDQIVLTVADDGIGSETGTIPRSPPGIGLTAIRERLDMLGGSLALDTGAGQGLRVTLRCPKAAMEPRPDGIPESSART